MPQKMMKLVLFIASLLVVLTIPGVHAANVTLEYDTSVPYATNYGYNPQSGLTYYNGKLYGVTRYGGGHNYGAIFAIDPTNSAITLLRSFSTTDNNGYSPSAKLTVSGGKLYGVAVQGGQYNRGTLFSMNTDGTGFTLLHTFEGANGDGSYPYGAVKEYNGKLYGTTSQGGANNSGTIFSINPNGTGYAVLHEFASSEGSNIYTGVTFYNDVLYGVGYQGGSTGNGTIYSMNPDGSNFTVLRNFLGGGVPDDGQVPNTELIVYNNKLYGTAGGGTNYKGVMFSINPDGSGYSKIISFTTVEQLNSTIVEQAGVFYLVATGGGPNGAGSVFSILPDGTNLTHLHAFQNNGTDGTSVYGDLALSANMLYGTTIGGGTSSKGTVFSVGISGSPYAILHHFTTSYLEELQTSFVPYNGKLYGTSVYGGSNDNGTFFSFDPATKQVTVLHSFTSAAYEPYSTPLLFNGRFYGTLASGGASSNGAIYAINPDGTNFEIIHSFAGGITDGVWPMASLIEAGGVFYGTTYNGGANNKGIIFSVLSDGTGYTVLHSFSAAVTDGSNPYSGVTHDNGKLFGTTRYGGQNNNGTLFSINTDGTGFSLLHSFNNGAGDGGSPQADLTLYNGKLYGTSEYGGTAGIGSLFSINTDGTGYQILHSFDYVEGDLAMPEGAVTFYEGLIYGVTYDNPTNYFGGIYSMNPDGSNFTVLHSFDGTDGANPYFHPGLTLFNGKFYGMTTYGGPFGSGTIYSYQLPDILPPSILSISPVTGSTLTDKSPLISLSINENVSCRASFTDESYTDMSNDISCTGGGTQNASCQIPDVGAVTSKTIYFACKDTSNNEQTALTNAEVTYTFTNPPIVTILPTTEAPTETPSPTPTPIPLQLAVSEDQTTQALLLSWNISAATEGTCSVSITDKAGTVVYQNPTVSCSEQFTILPSDLSKLVVGNEYTVTLTLAKDGLELLTESQSFTYKGFPIVTTPTVVPTQTTTPTDNTTTRTGAYYLTWIAVIIGSATIMWYLVAKLRKRK